MIQPRNDYVLIERLDNPDKIGRIFVPDIAQEKSFKGKVLAVGPGKLVEGVNGGLVRKKLEVKPGDRVLFNSKWSDFSSTHYVEDNPAMIGDHLHLVREQDIIGWAK